LAARFHWILWPALVVVLLDQLTKWWVVHALPLYTHRTVIPGFFDLVHVQNRGMAFGMMHQHEGGAAFYLLTAVTVGVIALILGWLIRMKEEERLLRFGLSLILGGAAGNLIDRLRLGAVTDFLDFYLAGYHWPAFNIADAAITVGTCLVAFDVLFRRKPGTRTRTS
jgi:signal peptidase II